MLRRRDLQGLAQAKLDDAEFLLAGKRFGSAYYLSGYAVEIGLKACISRQIRSEVIPDKQFVSSIFTHKLPDLVAAAGLTRELKSRRVDNGFDANWSIVSKWQPDSRYESIDPYTAQLLVSAVGDPFNGVLGWIKAYW